MIDVDTLDFDARGLIPAVVQHARDGTMLMLAYMNREALAATLATGRVTFWSRSRQRLWVKGETSGNHLTLRCIAADCDRDALLILAEPSGPACHLGTKSCFGDVPGSQTSHLAFLAELESVIRRRIADRPPGSYTSELVAQGPRRIAQKVGEEGVELALAAVSQTDSEVVGEAADLLYHLLLLLNIRNRSLGDVVTELELRHSKA